MKKTLPVVILCMLPLSAVIFLFYCLETYNSIVHNDSGFFVCLYSVFMFIVSLIIWIKNTAEDLGFLIHWIAPIDAQ